MAKEYGVYKCEQCGNIVEVIHAKVGTLVCCDQNMTLLEEKTADTSLEKHVPFLEELENGYRVSVGEKVKHPMTQEHYIEFIEIIAGKNVYRKDLKPGDEPIVIFEMEKCEKVLVREYCNIHGLWSK